MKRRLLSLVLVGVSVGALSGCGVARRTNAAVLSYGQVLKPGMTRKDVEDYFRANNVQFFRGCCAVASHGGTLDDYIEIGTQHVHFPLPCGETRYQVAFIFNEQKQHPPARLQRVDDLDTLQSIINYHWVDDCF